ncbi:MAG TPA: right-handed parallel beta-helix repeat-containing protein [Candidatus Binatia bacterium]|jgi:parallel beta-helix repeat protein|nr:right-handed parallel beta-helix repeat-containing protein [Candidatus Binatia bacterium]
MRSLVVVGIVLASALPAPAKVLTVHPGESIQAAVNLANPGDTVAVLPGTYHEAGTPCPTEPAHTCAVVVTKDGVRLRGLSKRNAPVVLENPGGQEQGIAFAKPGADGASCFDDPSQRIRKSQVRGFTVNGFDGDGIFLFCADDFRVTGNEVHDNGEYGIFPSHCTKGRVSHNVATGSNDTGIYIGQSFDVRVDRNLASGNVSGFEIENCTGVRMDHNEAHGNTGGILSFTLPFLDVKSNHDNLIDFNYVHDNNKPNTCLDPEDAVCDVPHGTGILLLAADANRVIQNNVRGNGSFGIAVANFCVAQGLDSASCGLLDIEPNADDNRILRNTALDNGTAPDPSVPAVFDVDLAWDLTGTGNCWSQNVSVTQFPPVLPACQ